MNPIEQLLEQAFGLQQAGRLLDAERLYQRILRSEPRHPEANHNIGRIALEEGRGEEALSYLKIALEADPTVAHAWFSYVDALLWLKRPLAARQVLEQGGRRGLQGPEVDALRKRLAEIEARRATVLDSVGSAGADPDTPASTTPPRDDATPSEESVRALRLLNDGQHSAEFEDATRAMVVRFPGFAEGWTMLGAALLARRSFSEAVEALASGVQLAPSDAGARVALATGLRLSGEPEKAEVQLRRALQIDPHNVDAHNNLGLLLQSFYREAEAERHLREALRLDPQLAAGHSNLGRVLQETGRADEAEHCFRRATELQPDMLTLHSTRLFNLAYVARVEPEEALAEARRFGERAAAAASARYKQWLTTPSPERLRVGLVSGDLREHPVGYFLEGLVAQLDDARIELFAYSNNHVSDTLTDKLRGRCAAWRALYSLGDAAAAQAIHADGVHVLVDLSGHTAHNRLPVFAYKPAPVQATWLGYFATTGLAEMDYLLADPISAPPEHHHHFTETIWALPETRLCFTPPPDPPPIAPLPALAKGYVTIGCFQNLAKLNDFVLDLWAKVLMALPAARLRIQTGPLADPDIRLRLLQRLMQRSIDPERVSLYGMQRRETYLAAYGEVDLVLDTFPFSGGTTTCEAMVMGVPTVTLEGDRMVGRQGACLLTAAGLADWIARTPEEFVEIAIRRASDLPALATLRSTLRTKVLASPLFDAPRFARKLEDALWGMWRQGPRRR